MHSEETWWFSERWLSRVTPRVLTVLDIGITEPEMLTDETGGNDAERCLVNNAYVLLMWPAQFGRKLVLSTRRKWPRPRRD